MAKKDYWQLAIQQLHKEDPSTIEQIAALQQAAAPTGQTDLAIQLRNATEQSRQTLEAKRWKIVVGSKEINVREQFDRLVRGVMLFKDVGNAAASLDPLHAGIPLAGFCVLMGVRLYSVRYV